MNLRNKRWLPSVTVGLALAAMGLVTFSEPSHRVLASNTNGFNVGGINYTPPTTTTTNAETIAAPNSPNQNYPQWIIFNPNIANGQPGYLDSQYYKRASVLSAFPSSDTYDGELKL